MTPNPQTETGDGNRSPLRADRLTRTARCCGLPARERGPARTAHSAPNTCDRKAAP